MELDRHLKQQQQNDEEKETYSNKPNDVEPLESFQNPPLVTLGEAFSLLNDCKGERRIYYTKENSMLVNLVLQRRKRFRERMMIVGAMTGRHVLPHIKVPHKVKINSEYYVANVLKPILADGVAKMYGTSKCFVHHDATSSHTARCTQAYQGELKAKTGINANNDS
ncbi:unnamed protein product [Allacma fusca]|uniref:Transposase n=1 Tax=Allacma fusca TaxID=39272 RepID=A0A8J2KZC0_9HEXA|nr:unnamed protein product [Allacma fusca]